MAAHVARAMTAAIDSNLIIALWDKSVSLNSSALAALESAFKRGPLVISAPVFAELLAAPHRTKAFVDAFLDDTAIAVDWELDELIWRRADRHSSNMSRGDASSATSVRGASWPIS